MALSFLDGFDIYSSTADVNIRWTHSSGSGPQLTTGRSGNGVRASNTNNVDMNRSVTFSTVTTVGVAFKVDSATLTAVGSGGSFLRFSNSGNTGYATLGIVNDGSLKLLGQGGSYSSPIATSAVGLIQADQWYYAEMVWNRSTGSVQAYVDGALVIDATNSSLVLSSSSGLAGMRNLSSTGPVYDDFYLRTDGNYMGPISVYVLRPTSDASPNDWTPSTGTDHSAIVGGATIGNANYISSAVAEDGDFYYVGPDSIPGSIFGAKINAYATATGGTGQFDFYIHRYTGDVGAFAGGQSPSSSWNTFAAVLETNPFTTDPWTVEELESYQFGVKVDGAVSSGELRVGSYWIEVASGEAASESESESETASESESEAASESESESETLSESESETPSESESEPAIMVFPVQIIVS